MTEEEKVADLSHRKWTVLQIVTLKKNSEAKKFLSHFYSKLVFRFISTIYENA